MKSSLRKVNGTLLENLSALMGDVMPGIKLCPAKEKKRKKSGCYGWKSIRILTRSTLNFKDLMWRWMPLRRCCGKLWNRLTRFPCLNKSIEQIDESPVDRGSPSARRGEEEESLVSAVYA